jgi:hypothetical protein
MSKTKRIEGPFQSEYGTFNPGDEAIAITVCTGRVRVARVEYVGYIERQSYDWQLKQQVVKKYAQVKHQVKRFTPFLKGTDEVAKWPYEHNDVQYRHVPGTHISTLQYNRLIPASVTTDELMKVI